VGPVEFFENMAVKKEGAAAGFVGVTVALEVRGKTNGDCASPNGRSVGDSNELAFRGIVTEQDCARLSRLRWGRRSASAFFVVSIFQGSRDISNESRLLFPVVPDVVNVDGSRGQAVGAVAAFRRRGPAS